jgi:hypothetical protein
MNALFPMNAPTHPIEGINARTAGAFIRANTVYETRGLTINYKIAYKIGKISFIFIFSAWALPHFSSY